MISELQSFTYIRMIWVRFRHEEILSLFSHCHMTFPYVKPLFFSGRFVQKIIVSCFSDSFDQKTTQQSDGSCNVTNDSQHVYKLFKQQCLFSGKHN